MPYPEVFNDDYVFYIYEYLPLKYFLTTPENFIYFSNLTNSYQLENKCTTD